MKKSVLAVTFALVLALVMVAACGSKTGSNVSVLSGKTIKSVTLGNLTATLSNSTGQLRPGNQEHKGLSAHELQAAARRSGARNLLANDRRYLCKGDCVA